MEVVNTPNQALALTNLSFVSAADIRRFPGSIALVGDALVLTLRYPCLSCEPIACLVPSSVRLISLARFICRISLFASTISLNHVQGDSVRSVVESPNLFP
jgi:hypothetical protein